ncbi:MAG: F0F1 ATP synthase subunit B [Clostridiales bacterium]|jgi:F-type H+-transporting ATPase subunit b|nr:F0F1 ATP synthase subunit B [Clostridiales bacterium]
MNLDPLEIIIHIINIIALFAILRFLLYDPIHSFMASRAQNISSRLDEADEAKENALKAKEMYDALISDSEEASEKKLAEIIIKANADAEAIVENANDRANAIISDARGSAEAERKDILDSVRGDITDISLKIAEKILSREISESDNRRIINSYFDGRE